MNKNQRAFTLIELLITMAMVAILAVVAIPSYQEHIRKSRRAEAQAYLMAVAGRQQQMLVDTRAYGASPDAMGLTAPEAVARAYDITTTVVAGPPPAFTITATPKGGQASEACGTLSVDQTGTRTAASPSCW